jgi:hypothetical protein
MTRSSRAFRVSRQHIRKSGPRLLEKAWEDLCMTSVPATLIQRPTPAPAAGAGLRRERRFFIGMAIVMALLCFAGFAPSYYLKAHFGTPQLKPLVHVHGLVFTIWMALLILQTSLVAGGRVRLHRQLGVAGAVVAVLMVVTGAAVAYGRGTTITPDIPHETLLAFLAIPAVALLLFPSLIGAALFFRRNAGAHKRLMLLATTIVLTAAVHRLLMLLVDPAVSPPVFFAATDVLIVALGTYDVLSRGRIHAATLWGGLLVILSQAASLLLAGSTTWMTFAHWITGT